MPQQKKANPAQIAANARGWLENFGEKSVRWLFNLTEGWEKRRDIIQNNFTLGQLYLKQGKFSDAALRFKFVTWLDARNRDAWYQLGCAYIAEGKMRMAQQALTQAQKLKPDSEETAYMLAIARGKGAPLESLPKTMPQSLALAHFEGLAASYNHEQLDQYGYQGHVQVTSALRAALTVGRIDHAMVDLGCGTGLCGPLVRDVAAELTGVDMSQAMIAQAIKLTDQNGKKIYDALINLELHEFLRSAADGKYDAIFSAGVFGFVGDLASIFTEASRALKPGGVFAFTADRMESGDFRFDPQAGRFRFSQNYLRGLAKTCGLKEVKCEEVRPYPDYPAWLCVFAK